MESGWGRELPLWRTPTGRTGALHRNGAAHCRRAGPVLAVAAQPGTHELPASAGSPGRGLYGTPVSRPAPQWSPAGVENCHSGEPLPGEPGRSIGTALPTAGAPSRFSRNRPRRVRIAPWPAAPEQPSPSQQLATRPDTEEFNEPAAMIPRDRQPCLPDSRSGRGTEAVLPRIGAPRCPVPTSGSPRGRTGRAEMSWVAGRRIRSRRRHGEPRWRRRSDPRSEPGSRGRRRSAALPATGSRACGRRSGTTSSVRW